MGSDFDYLMLYKKEATERDNRKEKLSLNHGS
jgi:hypothetical protein